EPVDVVEVRRAGADGEPQGLRPERVHRHRDPVRGEPLQDRGQAPPLLRGGNRRGARVTGGGTQLDDVGAVSAQPAGMRAPADGIGCSPRRTAVPAVTRKAAPWWYSTRTPVTACGHHTTRPRARLWPPPQKSLP